MIKLKNDDHLLFNIKGKLFKRIGIERDKTGAFNLVNVKNCEKGTTKKIRFDKLEKLIKENK